MWMAWLGGRGLFFPTGGEAEGVSEWGPRSAPPDGLGPRKMTTAVAASTAKPMSRVAWRRGMNSVVDDDGFFAGKDHFSVEKCRFSFDPALAVHVAGGSAFEALDMKFVRFCDGEFLDDDSADRAFQ